MAVPMYEITQGMMIVLLDIYMVVLVVAQCTSTEHLFCYLYKYLCWNCIWLLSASKARTEAI